MLDGAWRTSTTGHTSRARREFGEHTRRRRLGHLIQRPADNPTGESDLDDDIGTDEEVDG
jgi:hypothetical protein